ncbi:UDP-N-acetylmuramoyl-L-alanine--D-glutamate ligase [Ancylothrix sp. C2]|uniref:UDP-N-acetylmuramoyl-L-alanine--D-glutamate ligase n=1 Tax=Ancylothrix sp. D3o TaxID=2953691 RepID=UPI0021BB1523|nr:UDP-N-acetylmuramoyl-L-alanine--D-glutamate ligase [Ancylothrix sp. D3o]MCT7951089.1 UDP-N-acetylmuramoyl-L-alanine--D-glutamate ligase [Ancylothrix sp. D3o]
MPKAHIIGLGKSGIAGAKLLKREGWQVTLSDTKTSADFQQQKQQLEAEGITVLLSHAFNPEAEEKLDLVVVSPGVPWDIPALLKARELGIETIGEMELAWRYLNKRPWVAITGTNGKTTTTALIAAIFQTAGLHAPACGNIGYAACELALSETPPDWIIAEVSSYQIESSSTLAPRIAVWTTFTPDHLSRHKTLENYFNIKAKLLHQAELKIVNGDDPYLRQNAAKTWEKACWTSVQGKEALLGDFERGIYIENGWVIYQGEQVVEASALRMVGSHNLQNLLMAVAAAKLAGIDNKSIAKAIAEFPGVAHRLEHICNINGVDFINDSKATNYDAAEVGLSSVEAPAILIAGGDPKAGDDTGWLKVIQEKAVAVLLIGDAAAQFGKRLQDINHPRFEIVGTMEKAVKRSAELAPQLNAKVVLLSPACASFDQYQNFEQRGDDFRKLSLELAG